MLWEDRIVKYVRKTGFPRSLFVADDGRVVGTWIMGNDYRVRSGYYGGYPAGYLRRIAALFPDKRNVLHLFSGKVNVAVLPGDTVDVNPALKPTYVDDAQRLERVPLQTYDLVLVDPPYSVEDAERYQTTMIKRNSVMRALERLSLGTHVVWLDQVLPIYRKDAFDVEAVIGMVKSTNHRFRVITIFQRTRERAAVSASARVAVASCVENCLADEHSLRGGESWSASRTGREYSRTPSMAMQSSNGHSASLAGSTPKSTGKPR